MSPKADKVLDAEKQGESSEDEEDYGKYLEVPYYWGLNRTNLIEMKLIDWYELFNAGEWEERCCAEVEEAEFEFHEGNS